MGHNRKKAPLLSQIQRWSNNVHSSMRFVAMFLLLGNLQLSASEVYSQTATLSLNMANATIKEVIANIEKQGNFYFTYNLNQVNVNQKVSIQAKDKSIDEVLSELFDNQGIAYKLEDNHIALYKPTAKATATKAVQQKRMTVKGVVLDENGDPIIGANILEKGTTNGTISDMDGNFELTIDNATLQVSYIGYLPQTIIIKNH